MNRRELMIGAAFTGAAAAVPLRLVASPAIEQPPLRWFAVSLGDGPSDAIRARTAAEAAIEYAQSCNWSATIAESGECGGACWGQASSDEPGPCRFCGLDPTAPCSSVEVKAPDGDGWYAEQQPSPADWVRAGYRHTYCEHCDYADDDGVADHVVNDLAVCEECASLLRGDDADA